MGRETDGRFAMKTDTILVLIPCRNEEAHIGAVVRSVHQVLENSRVVVVNDASSDNSEHEALKAGAEVLSHSVHLGYGAALETGYHFAVENNHDVALQMDGDGQHHADNLADLYGPLHDGIADLVIGSRYLAADSGVDTPSLVRFAHRLLSVAILPVVGRRLTDPTSGFQGVGRRALTLFASGVFPCDYPDADVILMAALSGMRIQEVPARMTVRQTGESMHAGLKPIYYAMKMLLSMFVVMLNAGLWQEWRIRLGRGMPATDAEDSIR